MTVYLSYYLMYNIRIRIVELEINLKKININYFKGIENN